MIFPLWTFGRNDVGRSVEVQNALVLFCDRKGKRRRNKVPWTYRREIFLKWSFLVQYFLYGSWIREPVDTVCTPYIERAQTCTPIICKDWGILRISNVSRRLEIRRTGKFSIVMVKPPLQRKPSIKHHGWRTKWVDHKDTFPWTAPE